MIDYYDRQGNHIDLHTWAARFESPDAYNEYKRIGDDERNGVRVSTVWLGLNHNWGDGPPLIFETMVFGGDHDEEQWRWSTEEQARAGHAEICSAVFR